MQILRNPRILLACFGVVALAGVYLYAQAPGSSPAILDVIKIKDDLFVLHNAIAPGNVTVFVGDDGVLLVDDKFAIDHDHVVSEVKKLTNQPIKYVVNTHHHADHAGGNRSMQRMAIPVVSSVEARVNMQGTPRDGLFIDQDPGLPNFVFETRASLYVGGKEVRLYRFGRAHTDGDVVVLFPAARTLASGDIFTFGDETPQLIDYAGGGSAKEWPKTLDAALALDFDTVVPGHGVVATRADMRRFRETIASVNTRIHEMILQKKTRDDIARVLRDEFHWLPFIIDRAVDGLIGELQ